MIFFQIFTTKIHTFLFLIVEKEVRYIFVTALYGISECKSPSEKIQTHVVCSKDKSSRIEVYHD